MDYKVLRAELTNDPLARGYSGMTDKQVADSLNAIDRDQAVQSIGGQELFEAVVLAEYGALSASEMTLLNAFIDMGTIQVNGTNTKAVLLNMFGVGTTTRNNLAALQTTQISRATELGIGVVKEGKVGIARSV